MLTRVYQKRYNLHEMTKAFILKYFSSVLGEATNRSGNGLNLYRWWRSVPSVKM